MLHLWSCAGRIQSLTHTIQSPGSKAAKLQKFQISKSFQRLDFSDFSEGCPCQGSSSQFGRPVPPQSDTAGKSYGKSYGKFVRFHQVHHCFPPNDVTHMTSWQTIRVPVSTRQSAAQTTGTTRSYNHHICVKKSGQKCVAILVELHSFLTKSVSVANFAGSLDKKTLSITGPSQ